MHRPKSNRRKQIRQLARKATERAQGESPSPEPAAPSPRGSRAPTKTPGPGAVRTPFETMTCICGQDIRVKIEEDEQRCACPNCNRKFQATFVRDPQTGRNEIFPVFLDEADTTGQTLIAEPADAAGMIGNDSDLIQESAGLGEESLGLTPQPSSQPAVPAPQEPPELSFLCFCGKSMLARKGFYRSRVKCPGCSTRLFLGLSYDPLEQTWKITPNRVSEPPMGDTQTMPAI